MFAQLNLVQSLSKAVFLVAVATTAVLTTGCATPTGAAFTKAEAVPAGQAQVYLYRKPSFQACGLSSSVQFNNQDLGKLYCGAYVQVTAPAGEHVLGFKPGSMTKTYEVKLQLLDKQTQYVEFVPPPFLLGNAFMLGSEIIPRTPEQGVADMQGLKGVK
jgi:hypothetical protein